MIEKERPQKGLRSRLAIRCCISIKASVCWPRWPLLVSDLNSEARVAAGLAPPIRPQHQRFMELSQLMHRLREQKESADAAVGCCIAAGRSERAVPARPLPCVPADVIAL
jgi:hypothetical protein